VIGGAEVSPISYFLIITKQRGLIVYTIPINHTHMQQEPSLLDFAMDLAEDRYLDHEVEERQPEYDTEYNSPGDYEDIEEED